MAMTVDYSRGPVLEEGVDQGVHIIFIPPEVEADPGPAVLPSRAELDAAVLSAPDARPTDIIVFRGKPWHKVRGRLEKHPEVHVNFPETVLELRVEEQKAVWWSEHDFRITRIEPHAPAAAAKAATYKEPQPEKPFPEPPTNLESDVDGLTARIHVARSATPIREARSFEYKITFTRTGRAVDPNMRCL